jgi:integrase
MIQIDGYSFEGCYAELFENYVKHKRSLGYKYVPRHIRALAYMNRYLSQHPKITKEVAENWTAKIEGEAFRTQEQRNGLLRQFSLYLNSIDIKAYVPQLIPKKPSKFVPHIFTKAEISAIIHATDSLEYDYRSPFFHINYQFLIRLLYSTGLRISEALALQIKDVDFTERLIHIQQAKHNNSRIVPLPDGIWNDFLKFVKNTGRKDGFLFQNRFHRAYATGAILSMFKKIMQSACIQPNGNGRLPRLHDLRHTFAVHSLEQMIEQGVDIYVTIPYLSDFMGHRTIATTEQYLRLTSENFSRITAPTELTAQNLYPQEKNTYEGT